MKKLYSSTPRLAPISYLTLFFFSSLTVLKAQINTFNPVLERPAYCIVKKTINCATKTVKLEAFTQCSSTGVVTPDTVDWNTGQTAQTIIVNPPGLFSYPCPTDPGNPTVEVDLEAFFNGPLLINGPNVLCFGDDGVLTVNMPNSPGYNFPPGSFTWDPPSFSGQISPYYIPGQGTYTLNVTDAYDCPFSAVKNVVQSPPVFPIITGEFAICTENDTTKLNITPSYSQYSWQGGQATQSINVTQPGVYEVTVTNNFGCTGETQFEVSSADIDTVYGFISAPAICPGTPSTLQVLGPFVTFLWSTGQASNAINVTQPGAYSVTVTNQYGCTAARQFIVDPAATPVPLLNSPSICAGTAATLTVGGGSFTTFNWSNGQSTPAISVSTPGAYTVTVGDAAGCTGTGTTTVQTAPAAIPTISGLTEVCSPATAVLQASGGFSTYSWTTPGGGSGGNASSLTATQSGTYVVTVSNSAGCTGTASQSFLINPSPTPVVSLAPFACNGQMSLSADSGFSTYQWSNGATTQGISTQMDGNYVVTVATAAGCTGTAQLTVSIPPAPMTNITGVSALCAGVSGQLSASGGYTNYIWSNGQSGQNINAAAPGTYSVTATDAFGCTATATRDVNPSPPLAPVLGGPLAICVGSSAQISVNGTFDQYQWSTGAVTQGISASVSGNYTVTVTNNDGCTGTATHPLVVGTALSPQITAAPYNCDGKINLSAGGGFSTYTWSNSAATPGISVNASGNYAVTVTDNTGCTGTATFDVTIPAAPSVIISGSPDVCFGETTQLSATPGFASYAWAGGENTASITAQSGGSFSVTVADALGCTATATFGVTVNPPILPAISGPAAICQNTNAMLSLNTNFSTYQWSNGQSTPTISVSQNGPFFVTVTDAIGCTAVAEHGLLVNPAPMPILSQNIYDCDHAIDLLCSNGFSNYVWSTGSATANAIASISGNYVVTVSDAIGCTGTASILVDIPADPVVSIATAQPFCQGGSGQLQASGSFSNYIWSNGQATTGITVNAAGNFSVTVTDQFGCTATATTAVSVLPLPQPVVQGPPEMCAGASFSLSVGGGVFNQFSWSNGSIGATTNISFPGTYAVTVTDQNGCKNSNSITVAPGTPPLAVVGPGQTLTCIQSSVELSGTGSSSGPNISYQWVSASGSTIQNPTSLMPVVSTAGVYRLVVTNEANGCTASASVTVDQSADVPTVVAGQPQILTCAGPSTLLDGAGTSTGTDFQYLWTTVGGNIVSGANTLNPRVDKPGTYFLQVLNTSNNCTATASVLVTEDKENPVISVGPPETLTCAMPTLDILAVTVSSSSQVFNYLWTTVGGNILAGHTTAVARVNKPGSYTVVVTDAANGCTGSATKIVNVDADLPLPEIALPKVLTCKTPEVVLDASASSFGPNFQYTWKTPDGHFVNQNDPQMPVVDQPGDYLLLITNTVNGCADSVEVEVKQSIIAPPVDAGVAGILTCKTTSLQLSGSTPLLEPDLTFLWTSTGGNVVSGETSLTPTIDKPGKYRIVLTDESNGCTSSDEVTVGEDVKPPVLSISTPGLLTCVDKTTSITASASSTGNAPTFVWTTTSGNIVSQTNTPTVTVDQPGTYVFTATNNENGCTATIQTLVNQNIAPPPVSVENPLLLTCSRTELGLKAVFSQNLTVSWTTADGQILTGSNSATPTVGQTGTYRVLVTNPADGCTNTAEIVVNEETNKPKGLDFDLTPPDCTGKKGIVSVASVAGGVLPLSYSINGGQTFLSKTEFSGLAPGDYVLVVKDANGCTFQQPLSVPPPAKPAVELPAVFELDFGDSLRLEPIFPPGFPVDWIDSAFWKPLDDLTFENFEMPDLLTPSAKPFRTTSYTLTVVTPEGCTATATTKIKVVGPGIYVPNAINPNDPQQDGNDVFTIFAHPKAVAMVKNLQVFDRWGEQVFSNQNFQPNDPNAGWKGDFRKKPNTPSVFVWYAEVLLQNGEVEFLKGDVTVVK